MTLPCVDTTPKRTREHVKRLPPPGPDVMLTIEEAAAELGIGVSTFWHKVKIGHLPPAVYLFPKMPRWPRGKLHEYLESRRKASETV